MSERYSDAAGVRDRLVLGYHAVSELSPSRLTVTREDLRRQVAAIVGRGYVGTTFNRAVLEPSPEHRLAVTFDDDDPSIIDHAFPVLNELGVPGTAFVVVALVGMPGHLSWDDIATLAAAGWEVGSHTLTHPLLTELNDPALDEELHGSREAIQATLGVACRSIAYPYGASDTRVSAAAARAGFTAGCTTSGALEANALDWPRVGVDGNDGHVLFRLKTSRLGRKLRESVLGAPLERTGRAMRAVRASQPS